MVEVLRVTRYVDPRGTICIAEVGKEVPFQMRGIAVLYSDSMEAEAYEGRVQVLVVKGSAVISTAAKQEEIFVDQCMTVQGPLTVKASAPESIVLLLTDQELDRASAVDLKKTSMYFGKNVERAFYLKDVIEGQDRGGHAHQYCHQSLICLRGSLEVVLHDGSDTKTVLLEKGGSQLHIPPFVWAKEQNFSAGAICLVLASHPYNRAGYMDTIEEMIQIRDEV